MPLPDQVGVEVEVKTQPAISLLVINLPCHKDISCVMVSFGFNKALIEIGQLGIAWTQRACQYLEFFAAPALDQAATNKVIDHLVPSPVAN